MSKPFHQMNARERSAWVRNPIVRGTMKAAIAKDMEEIQRLADWEVWVRAGNPTDLIYSAGRLFWITDYAAKACDVSPEMPELRIVAGAASALGDIAARPQDVETHRRAVQSGLSACERLWPALDLFALADGALNFKDRLAGAGITLHDFNCARP
jgi:hypothetical protein